MYANDSTNNDVVDFARTCCREVRPRSAVAFQVDRRAATRGGFTILEGIISSPAKRLVYLGSTNCDVMFTASRSSYVAMFSTNSRVGGIFCTVLPARYRKSWLKTSHRVGRIQIVELAIGAS